MDWYSRKTIIMLSVPVYSLGTVVTPLSAGFLDMSFYRIFSGVGEGVRPTALYAIVGSFFFRRRPTPPGSSASPPAAAPSSAR